jgi:hypothetical protein
MHGNTIYDILVKGRKNDTNNSRKETRLNVASDNGRIAKPSNFIADWYRCLFSYWNKVIWHIKVFLFDNYGG